MSSWITWCFACMLSFCVMLKPSQNQDCATEKMKNIVIDIKAALSKGIRGRDPIHTTSWEACVNVCCSGKKIAENLKETLTTWKPAELDLVIIDNNMCNYVIFNARMKRSYPNCYLFYYPIKETCPLKQVLGMVTYRIIKDPAFFQVTPSPIKSSQPTLTGNFVSPQTTISDPHSSASHLHSLSPTQKPTDPKEMAVLGYMGKPLVKISGHSKNPKDERGNSSENINSSPVHESRSSLLSSTQLSIVSTSTQAGTVAFVIPPKSHSTATSTRSTTTYYEKMLMPTVSPLNTTTLQSSAILGTSASNLSSLFSSLPAHISSASLHNDHLSNGQQVSESYILDGVRDTKDSFYHGDKSILFAALLFGVIFFVLITGLVGRRMLESLQQRHYTRLDYLINGMYAHL